MARAEKKGPKRETRKIMLGPFRMAFVNVFDPEETDFGDRFSVTALFPPAYDLKPLEDLIFDAYEEAFGKDEAEWPSGRNDKHPADVIGDAGKKKYDGYKTGWSYVGMSSKDPPGIVDADRNEVINKREAYGGRWARAAVNVAAYDNKSKGVGVYLNHLQLLDHDEAFGGKGRAEDEFDSWQGEIKDKEKSDTNRRGRDEDRDDSRDRSRDRSRGPQDDSRSSRREETSRRDDSRSRGRDTGPDRERGREESPRRSRDEDRPRDSRDRSRDDERDDTSRRGRDRAEDERDRDSSRRESSRRDSRDDDERPSRSRDNEDDRPSRRDREDDRGRSRDDDGRSSRRSRDDNNDWN